MDKLSPGDDSLSLYVLRSLPQHRFEVVVDAGCGAGRQTFVLADELKTLVHAVDSYQPFLDRLRHRAKEKNLAQLVRTHWMDMKDIPSVFPIIDPLCRRCRLQHWFRKRIGQLGKSDQAEWFRGNQRALLATRQNSGRGQRILPIGISGNAIR